MKLKNSGSLAAFAMQNILKDRLVMSIYLGLHLLEGVLLISVVASVWHLAVMVFFRQYDDRKLDTKLERNMRRHNITRVQSACWVLLLTVLERLIHCTSLLYYDTVQSSFSVHSEISVLFTSWSVNVSSFPGDQPPPLRAKNIPCFSKETGQKRTAVWIRKFRSCITWSIYDKDHMSELRIFTQGSNPVGSLKILSGLYSKLLSYSGELVSLNFVTRAVAQIGWNFPASYRVIVR